MSRNSLLSNGPGIMFLFCLCFLLVFFFLLFFLQHYESAGGNVFKLVSCIVKLAIKKTGHHEVNADVNETKLITVKMSYKGRCW